jgi:pSer/pThr/pTyr-binding forkhead associated (FHA) protein
MSSKNLENQTIPYKAFVVMDAQVFLIDKLLTSIGRNLDNDLMIQDPQVSRKHAEIRFKDGAYEIVDLDSSAGTYVNNVKVKQSKIYSGDLILIAGVPLMFLDEKDAAYKDFEKQTDQIKKLRKSSGNK